MKMAKIFLGLLLLGTIACDVSAMERKEESKNRGWEENGDADRFVPEKECSVKDSEIDKLRELLRGDIVIKDVERLLDPSAQDFGLTPLLQAINLGDIESVQALIKAGANVNRETDTTLFIARTPLALAVLMGYKGMTETLLRFHADANQPDKNGNTPLIIAVTRQFAPTVFGTIDEQAEDVRREGQEILELLIKNGADINKSNNLGFTPLHRACFIGSNSVWVELLLKFGADVTRLDNRAKTPLHLAIERERKDIIRILVRHYTSKGIEIPGDLIPKLNEMGLL